MKLRTFTGLQKQATCACGCRQTIYAGPDTQVIVDMDSPKWKRDRYLPGHAGNGYGSTNYAQKVKKEETPKQAPTPAPPAPAPAGPTAQAPSPPTPEPQAEPAPVPTPKVRTSEGSSSLGPSGPSVVTGTAPSLADNRPWKILQVTISVGDYTSVKAGVADFGKENESLSQLGTRLVAELTQDIKTELDVVHRVQEGKPPSVQPQGVAVATPATPYPAQAGAPKLDFTPANALMAHYERQKAYEAALNDSETVEAIRRVQLELSDISVARSAKKRKLAQSWLETRGYEKFEESDVQDLPDLQELLVRFDRVNEPDKFSAMMALSSQQR